jgi:hypothetical protein
MTVTIEIKQTQTFEIQTPAFHRSEYSAMVYYISDDVIIKAMPGMVTSYNKADILFDKQAVEISKLPATTSAHFKSVFDDAINNIKLKRPYNNI